MGKIFVYEARQHSLSKGFFAEPENALRATGAELGMSRFAHVTKVLENKKEGSYHMNVAGVSYSVTKSPLQDT